MGFSPHTDVARSIGTVAPTITNPSFDWTERKLEYVRMGPGIRTVTPYQVVAYRKKNTGVIKIHWSRDQYDGDWLGRTWKTTETSSVSDADDSVSVAATNRKVVVAYLLKASDENIYWRTSEDEFKKFYKKSTISSGVLKKFVAVPSPNARDVVIIYIQQRKINAFSVDGVFSGTKSVSLPSDVTTIRHIDAYSFKRTIFVFVSTNHGLYIARLNDPHTSSPDWVGAPHRFRAKEYDAVRVSISPANGRRAIVAYRSDECKLWYQTDSLDFEGPFDVTSQTGGIRDIDITWFNGRFRIWFKRAVGTSVNEIRVSGALNSPVFSEEIRLADSIPQVDNIGYFAPHKCIWWGPQEEPLGPAWAQLFEETRQLVWNDNSGSGKTYVYPTEASPNWVIDDSVQSPDPISPISPGAVLQYSWVKRNTGGLDVNERATIAGRNLSQASLLAAKRNTVPIQLSVFSGFLSGEIAPRGTVVRYDVALSARNDKSKFGITRGDKARFQAYDVVGIIQTGGIGTPILDDDLTIGYACQYTFWQLVPIRDGTMVLVRSWTTEEKTGLRYATYKPIDPSDPASPNDWEFWFDFNSVNQPYWCDFGDIMPAIAPTFALFPNKEDESAGLVMRVKEFPTGTLEPTKREQAFYYLDISTLTKNQ